MFLVLKVVESDDRVVDSLMRVFALLLPFFISMVSVSSPAGYFGSGYGNDELESAPWGRKELPYFSSKSVGHSASHFVQEKNSAEGVSGCDGGHLDLNFERRLSESGAFYSLWGRNRFLRAPIQFYEILQI